MTHNVFSGTLSPTQSIYKVLKPKINLQDLANYVHRSESGGAGCQSDDRRSKTGSVATTQKYLLPSNRHHLSSGDCLG